MIIPVLMYHSISYDSSPISITPKDFEKHLIFFKNYNYETINLNEINQISKSRPFIITFDDGYKDNLLEALPLLKKYNFKATCFITTNFIGKTNKWDENKKNFTKKNIMGFDEIKEWISNNMQIGSHTHNHLNLENLNNSEIINELAISKKILIDNFKINVDCVSYPFGRLNNNIYNLAKDYYKKAVTTNRSRYNTSLHGDLLIPRINMGKNLSKFKLFLKIKTIYEDIKFDKTKIYL